jgi:hypothetical protein
MQCPAISFGRGTRTRVPARGRLSSNPSLSSCRNAWETGIRLISNSSARRRADKTSPGRRSARRMHSRIRKYAFCDRDGDKAACDLDLFALGLTHYALNLPCTGMSIIPRSAGIHKTSRTALHKLVEVLLPAPRSDADRTGCPGADASSVRAIQMSSCFSRCLRSHAFKQNDEELGTLEESEDTGTVDLTTGWETLLEALVGSGFQITATWPIRASFKWRVRALGANALASYIVLACGPVQRPRHNSIAVHSSLN